MNDLKKENIEVEIRSFISESEYNHLISFFKKNAEFINEDCQETYYFDAKEDLRIQKNDFFSKIWMKKGNLHDDAREEIEIKFPKEDFEKLEKIFLAAGLNVQIKWFRKRHTFRWGDRADADAINVMIDHTRGYGWIIELEKMSDESGKEKALAELKEKLSGLNIALTPKEEFERKYKHYKQNWKELIQ